MKTVREAASSLCAHLDYPPWLTCIGSGDDEIILYLRTGRHPHLPCLEDGWEGYPVSTRPFGEFANMGGPA